MIESIKYAGNKRKLLPQIKEMVAKIDCNHFWDVFSGSTVVSQSFSKDCNVISSDISEWSKVLATCYLLNKKEKNEYKELIDHLNNLSPIDGWFTENYGGEKRPWQVHNTRKLDAIREEVDRLELDEITKSVSLTSLILALDKVDNTLGHYVAYLKDFSARSYNNLELKVPDIFPQEKEHIVLQDNVFNLLDKVHCDLAYIDPPYGTNNKKMPSSRVRYNSYYHVWKTIILNDRPKLFGKCNRREDSRDKYAISEFESTDKEVVIDTFNRLFENIQSNHVLLSYNTTGILSIDELQDIITKYGKIIEIKNIPYKKNVMGAMTSKNEWNNDSLNKNEEILVLFHK